MKDSLLGAVVKVAGEVLVETARIAAGAVMEDVGRNTRRQGVNNMKDKATRAANKATHNIKQRIAESD